MTQRHCRNSLHVFFSYCTTSFKRRERARSTHDRQLTTMTVNFEIRAELRNLLEHWTLHRDLHQPGTRARDSLPKLLLIRGERLTKRIALAIVRFTTLNDVNAVLEIIFGGHFGMQSEAIEQLRTQLTFFRIAGTYQNKTCRMFDGNTFALDFIHTSHGDVEQ